MSLTKDIKEKFKKILLNSQSVALFCHINPDGDTLGCGLAMFFALKKLGKSVNIFCDDEVPQKLSFLEGAENIQKFKSLKDFDLAVALDCSDAARIGGAATQFLKFKNTVAIDHHISHDKFAKFTVLDSNASANAEIVFELFEHAGLIDDQTAKLIFCALVADNGCFSFSSTTAKSHEIAAKLYRYNFNASEIIYDIWKKKSLPIFLLGSRALSKCRFFCQNRIAFITFTLDDFKASGATHNDTEGVITSVIDIDTVEVAFALSEVNEFSFKVSIRTKSVNAAECAMQFGGGGHERAAGCRISGRYEEVVEKLLKTASDRLS